MSKLRTMSNHLGIKLRTKLTTQLQLQKAKLSTLKSAKEQVDLTRCKTQDKLAEDKNGEPMTLNNLAQKASETKTSLEVHRVSQLKLQAQWKMDSAPSRWDSTKQKSSELNKIFKQWMR